MELDDPEAGTVLDADGPEPDTLPPRPGDGGVAPDVSARPEDTDPPAGCATAAGRHSTPFGPLTLARLAAVGLRRRSARP